MKPALTKEEWKASEVKAGDWLASVGGDPQNGIPHSAMFVGNPIRTAPRVPPDKRHALAALALHGLKDADGRDLGFTHEDVRLLSTLGTSLSNYHDIVAVESLMDRLVALLPPEAS